MTGQGVSCLLRGTAEKGKPGTASRSLTNTYIDKSQKFVARCPQNLTVIEPYACGKEKISLITGQKTMCNIFYKKNETEHRDVSKLI